MAKDQKLTVNKFKGIRNDLGSLFTPPDYFFSVQNFSQDNTIGANKTLAPERINSSEYSTGNDIDGTFKYEYLDQNNVLQKEIIIASGGSLFKGFNATSSFYSGMTAGKVNFAVHQDKLYLFNGKDYPKIYDGYYGKVYEMGAPEALPTSTVGNLKGTYSYEMTYVTSGGEERLGTVSNEITVVNKKVDLVLPIGYSGTTSRKVYRTEAGGSTKKLLTTIADNTTTSYTDNTRDSSLGSPIIDVSNTMTKPYFGEVLNNRLFCTVVDKYPTQGFITDAGIEVYDPASFVDISNTGDDNSAVVGIKQDYDKIIAASEKQIYVVDIATSTVSVKATRANIGCLSGYSMEKVPNEGSFPGGVMFVSSDYTVRLFNGNFAAPIATSLDNLKTDNWAQSVEGTLFDELQAANTIHAAYNNFKYHLLIDEKIYNYDIQAQGWMSQNYSTSSYTCKPNTLAVINNTLYNGQREASYIEKMYSDEDYRGEDYTAFIETPHLLVSDEQKYFKSLVIYATRSKNVNLKVTVWIDDNLDNPNVYTINNLDSAPFDGNFYSSTFFKTSSGKEDYRIIYINKYGRWIKFKIESSSGSVFFRGYSLIYDQIINKEGI